MILYFIKITLSIYNQNITKTKSTTKKQWFWQKEKNRNKKKALPKECFAVNFLFTNIQKNELVYKPSSVFDGHLSRHNISAVFKRCKQQVEQTICRYLASSGVYMAPVVANRSVSSYLAFSTLPQKWR